MSKRQSTYWARLPGREVRHLWRSYLNVDESVCGLFDYSFDMVPHTKGRKCKSCERALAK